MKIQKLLCVVKFVRYAADFLSLAIGGPLQSDGIIHSEYNTITNMNKQARKVDVILRRFFGGDIIALFPGLSADMCSGHCLSYQKVGQHGAAGVDMSDQTEAVNEEEPEALELLCELRCVGYDPRIVSRFTKKHLAQRKEMISA